MAKFIDITNQKYNNLIAIKPMGKDKHRRMLWLCKCDCGNTRIVSGMELRNGRAKSCGCMRNKDKIKQFCIRGHEMAVTGRDKRGNCVECVRIRQRQISKTEKYKIARRKWEKRHNQTEKRKAYRREWAQKKRQTAEYKAYFIPYKKQYDLEHPEQVKLSRLKAKTNRALRIVPWGQEGMIEFYRNMPKGMTQDHYIPLQGDLVSGFHVIWNLRYLSQSENSKKNNNVDLLKVSEWYGKLLEEAGLKEKR